MNEINKLLNFSTNVTENLYKIMLSIKLNTKVYVIFLLNMLMKTKMILFHKHEYKKN